MESGPGTGVEADAQVRHEGDADRRQDREARLHLAAFDPRDV